MGKQWIAARGAAGGRGSTRRKVNDCGPDRRHRTPAKYARGGRNGRPTGRNKPVAGWNGDSRSSPDGSSANLNYLPRHGTCRRRRGGTMPANAVPRLHFNSARFRPEGAVHLREQGAAHARGLPRNITFRALPHMVLGSGRGFTAAHSKDSFRYILSYLRCSLKKLSILPKGITSILSYKSVWFAPATTTNRLLSPFRRAYTSLPK